VGRHLRWEHPSANFGAIEAARPTVLGWIVRPGQTTAIEVPEDGLLAALLGRCVP